MNHRIGIARWPVLLALGLLGSACVPVPHLTPNYEGLGDLPLQVLETLVDEVVAATHVSSSSRPGGTSGSGRLKP